MRTLKYYLILYLFFTSFLFSQWLDKQSLKNVVLIETKVDNVYKPFGTGFLFWNYNQPEYAIVVTCAHLLNKKELYITLNADSILLNYVQKSLPKINTVQSEKHLWFIDKNKLRCRIQLSQYSKAIHPSLDIGAFLLDIPRGEQKDDSGRVILKFSDVKTVSRSFIKSRKDISLGDEVYFVGFPFGIGSLSDQIEPLVRSGSVAWMSNTSDEFLLDSFSFGGNSGSPIYLKSILGSKPGKLEWDQSFLIGIIIGHHSISLDNILTQPNPNELKFEKGSVDLNIGLARCLWADDILKVVDMTKNLKLPD
jgi:hypothetical protein